MDKKLIEAVREQLGSDSKKEFRETLKDVSNHGANAGFSGFTYYAETSQFWRENKDSIKELLKDDSENCGIGILEMVKGFSCLNDLYSLDEIGEVIYGGEENAEIENALAWFALESAAYAFDN